MSQHIDNLVCWNCGDSLEGLPQPLSRHDHCPGCFEVLHCCRLCRHFNLDAVDGCREDRAEPPINKAEANFCDYFEPVALGLNARDLKPARDAAQKLEKLFSDPNDIAVSASRVELKTATSNDTEAATSNDPKAALDALFKSSSTGNDDDGN